MHTDGFSHHMLSSSPLEKNMSHLETLKYAYKCSYLITSHLSNSSDNNYISLLWHTNTWLRNAAPLSDVMRVMTHWPHSVTSSPVTGNPSLQISLLHVRGIVFIDGLLAPRSDPRENNLRRVSSSHAAVSLHNNKCPEQQLINNLQPDGKVLCFPPALTTCLYTSSHSCLPVANLYMCVCGCVDSWTRLCV